MVYWKMYSLLAAMTNDLKKVHHPKNGNMSNQQVSSSQFSGNEQDNLPSAFLSDYEDIKSE